MPLAVGRNNWGSSCLLTNTPETTHEEVGPVEIHNNAQCATLPRHIMGPTLTPDPLTTPTDEQLVQYHSMLHMYEPI